MYQRRYETLMLIQAELADDGQEQFKRKVFDILEQMKGRLIQEEDWGRRRLAYPVKKQMYGVFYLMDYMGTPELLAELERNLRIDERVFKYMTQVLDKNFTEEKFEKTMEQLKLERARYESETAEPEGESDVSDSEEAEAPARPEPEKAEPPKQPEPDKVESQERPETENVEPREQPADSVPPATEAGEAEVVESPGAEPKPEETPDGETAERPSEEPAKD